MPIAAIGILKAGAGYQPLDPSYPSERLEFMMQDADAQYLIAVEDSDRGMLNGSVTALVQVAADENGSIRRSLSSGFSLYVIL